MTTLPRERCGPEALRGARRARATRSPPAAPRRDPCSQLLSPTRPHSPCCQHMLTPPQRQQRLTPTSAILRARDTNLGRRLRTPLGEPLRERVPVLASGGIDRRELVVADPVDVRAAVQEVLRRVV